MDSNTSSDININILDKQGHSMNIPSFKKESSDTDLYLNLLANPVKSREASENSTSSLHLNEEDSDKNTSSVKMSHKSLRESARRHDSSSSVKELFRSDKKHSDKKHSERHSTERSNSSKARYENVDLSEPEPVKLSPQQLRMKKIDLLRKLCDLKTKGYKLTKEYDFNSSIEEMEYEYELLKSFADRRAGIKLYKNTIINLTNLVEFFNEKYDPFGIELEGWSEHMSVEVDSYDDVLEELYEKYKGAGRSLPPEIKLLILIGFSASAYHFSHKHMSSMPGNMMGGIQNNIAQKIASMGKEKSKFMSEQELNIERQREELKQKEKMMKETMKQNMAARMSQPPPEQSKNFIPEQSPLISTASNFVNAHHPVNFSPGGPPSLIIPSNDPRPLIKTDENVKDILNRLHSREVDTVDTQDESANDRLLSDTTASESKKRGRKKKNLMTIQ